MFLSTHLGIKKTQIEVKLFFCSAIEKGQMVSETIDSNTLNAWKRVSRSWEGDGLCSLCDQELGTRYSELWYFPMQMFRLM